MNINPFELKSLAAFLSSYTNCWIVFLHKRQFQNYLPHNKSTQSISYSNFFEFQFTARYWQQHHSIQLYLCFRAAQMKSSAESRPLEMGKCVFIYIFINEKRFIIIFNIYIYSPSTVKMSKLFTVKCHYCYCNFSFETSWTLIGVGLYSNMAIFLLRINNVQFVHHLSIKSKMSKMLTYPTSNFFAYFQSTNTPKSVFIR